MMVGLRIMKKVQKAYDGDNNRHLKEEMNLLFVDLGIMKRMQEAYSRDSNEHL